MFNIAHGIYNHSLHTHTFSAASKQLSDRYGLKTEKQMLIKNHWNQQYTISINNL